MLIALQPGDVVTYGDVAAEAGYPGAARGVGAILAHLPAMDDGPPVPWWRVVTASGRLVPGNEADHARRLRAEGVDVSGGSVRVPRQPAPARRARGGRPRSHTIRRVDPQTASSGDQPGATS